MDDLAPDALSVDDGREDVGRDKGPPGETSLTDPAEADKEERARRKAEEAAWIRRAQSGDEGAFAWLVRRYEVRAYRIARGLLPNEEDARDVAQEAFLRVFRSIERFDFGYAFTTWLHRIVTNFAAESDGVTTDSVIEKLVEETPSKEGELTSDPRLQKIFAA